MNYRLYLLKKRLIKVRYKFICLIGIDHIRWIKKKKLFASIGENCFYQPTTLPNEPKLIKLHDNVKIATNVSFYCHDVINAVFADMDKVTYQTHASCIEIGNNVFVGGGSIIIAPCHIGNNVIIAAGSVITKDVPNDVIVGGNPARVIGDFGKLKEIRAIQDKNKASFNPEEKERIAELWDSFSNNE